MGKDNTKDADRDSNRIDFEQLQFFQSKDSEEFKAVFLKHYTFKFQKSDLGFDCIIGKDFIEAKTTEKALNNAISKVIDRGFSGLTNAVTGRRAVYIHKNSGIPLIGTNLFGIVDRNTNCIEIKPLTGCNLNCIYCSVDEGSVTETKKGYDFLVEKDYLLSEIRKLVSIKKKTAKGLEIHIGPQGEPLLYPEIAELIKGLSVIPEIERISMDTNGLLLHERFIDELVDAGLTRFNISLNSTDKQLCDKISNRKFNLDRLIKSMQYIDDKYASVGRCEMIIAPVLMSGLNDSEKELDGLITLAKRFSGLKNGIKIGIQNFLYYKGGRNPVKEKDWKGFYDLLKSYQEKHGTKLILDANDFYIEENKVLQKPFDKGNIVRAEIKCPGAYPEEKIAVASDRCITIRDCHKDKGFIQVKIIRDKHNIFDGILVK